MAVSLRDPALAALRPDRSTATPLEAALPGWRRAIPEARRLTLQVRLPRGVDAETARGALLDLLARWTGLPTSFEHQALAFEVASTGSASRFCLQLADAACSAGRELVLEPSDALPMAPAPQQASDTLRTMALALQSSPRHLLMGANTATLTLPCRWLRSGDDAQWAAEQGLPIRLIPGIAADPRQPQRDPGAALRSLLRQVAGRVPHVTLAWPDPGAAHEALRILRCNGTACDLEVAAEAPSGALRQMARSLGVPVRLRGVWGLAGDALGHPRSDGPLR